MSSPRVSVTTRAAEPAPPPPTEYVMAMDEETAKMLLDLIGEVTGGGAVRVRVNAVYDALADHFPGAYRLPSRFVGSITVVE